VATFADSKQHDTSNIRKPLELAIFVKPWEESDDPITQIHDATGLLVPAGYVGVGVTTKSDGASWSRDQEVAETESHGYATPTRRDITKDQRGLSFTMQESKRQSMELYHGLRLSSVTTDSDGNFYFDTPSRPEKLKWRALAIGKDGAGPDAIYMARWLPLAEIAEQQEQAWQEEQEIQYPAQFTAYLDDAVGTAFRELWGGPGLDHAAMGFPEPPA
jgi:hypothetical protein